MINLDRLLSIRRKDTGNSGASSSSRQPSKGVEKDSRPPPCPKGKSTSKGAAEVAFRSKGKEPAPQAKRPKPSGSEIRLGKGKPLCPHLLNTDSSQDLWCHPELGAKVMHHAIRYADLAYVKPLSSRELGSSVYCDLARVPAAVETLVLRAEAYEDMRSKAEDFEVKCRDLTRELSQLRLDRDSTRKQLEEELAGVQGELKTERSTGRGYLNSLGGQRYMKSLEDATVLKYKESDDFNQFLTETSVPIFNQCLTYCQERLVNSGRFPGETFEFLDPDWVEMIGIPSSGALAAARSSQGTSLLPTCRADDDAMVDIEGEDVAP